MESFGFVDQRDSKTVRTPRVPRSSMSTRQITRALVLYLQKIPGAVEEVLRTYDPEPIVWKIPSLYAGEFQGIQLQACLDSVGKGSKHVLHTEFNDLLQDFYRNGWKHGPQSKLRKRFGEEVFAPFLVEKMNTASRRMDTIRLACEYLSLVSTLHGNLIVEDNSYFIHVEGFQPVGIVRGTLSIAPLDVVIEVTAEELAEVVLAPRGHIICAHYSACDRAATWLLRNSHLTDAYSAISALGALKLQFQPRVEYEFEQGLVRGYKESEAVTVTYTIRREEFSDASLDAVREEFYNIKSQSVEAYLEAYKIVVPRFLDVNRFMVLFGKPPKLTLIGKERVRQAKRLDDGFERFVKWFLAEQHKYRRDAW